MTTSRVQNESGALAMEVALILSLLILVLVANFASIAQQLGKDFQRVGDNIGKANDLPGTDEIGASGAEGGSPLGPPVRPKAPIAPVEPGRTARNK